MHLSRLSILAEEKKTYQVQTLWPDGLRDDVRDGLCAVHKDQLAAWGDHGEQTKLAQLVRLVSPVMVHVKHIFCGLKRPCRVGDNKAADATKLIFVCSPESDYEHSKVSCRVEPKSPPTGKVLTIIVSPAEPKHQATWPKIDGWIEHWCWVEEARDLAYAPIHYSTRYSKRLWSRKK